MSRKSEPSYKTEREVFPTNLRMLMKENKVTQKRLAAAIEMRPQTVSLYVTGQSVPDIKCLAKIADFFTVSTDWLLGRSGDVRAQNSDVRSAAAYTNLSETAVDVLHDFPTVAGTVSALLDGGKQCIKYWKSIAAILSAPEGMWNVLLGEEVRHLTTEEILSLYFGECERFLRSVRESLKDGQH